MNMTNTYKKPIIFAASILTLNAATVPAVAALSNDSFESLSNESKTELHLPETEKDSSQSLPTEYQGACDINPRAC